MAATASPHGVRRHHRSGTDVGRRRRLSGQRCRAKHWNLGVGNGRACGATGSAGAVPRCTVVAFWWKYDIQQRMTDDERRTILEMMAKGSYARVLLATADLDGAFARLHASGADIVQEPTEQPYGVRDCAVRDPAGNLIRISERRVGS
jgi:catechol 2,3-dioxygenase-like lactoylglutathione lyase family enzyme